MCGIRFDLALVRPPTNRQYLVPPTGVSREVGAAVGEDVCAIPGQLEFLITRLLANEQRTH